MAEKQTLLWVDHWTAAYDKPRPYTSDAGSRPSYKKPVREEAWYLTPKGATIELFLCFDLIAAIPMETKIEFDFTYVETKPTGADYRKFDHRFVLIGIFNIAGGPTPEDLLRSSRTDDLAKKLKLYFQERFRMALRQAIASRLECEEVAIGDLHKIVNRHTNLVAEY